MEEVRTLRDFYSVAGTSLGHIEQKRKWFNNLQEERRYKHVRYPELEYATSDYRASFYKEHLFELPTRNAQPVPNVGDVIVLAKRKTYDPGLSQVTRACLTGYESIGVYEITDVNQHNVYGTDVITGRKNIFFDKGFFGAGIYIYKSFVEPLEGCDAYLASHKEEFLREFEASSGRRNRKREAV